MGCLNNWFRRTLVCLGLKRKSPRVVFLLLFLGIAFIVITARSSASKHISSENITSSKIITTKHTRIHTSEAVTIETDVDHSQREIANKVTRKLRHIPSRAIQASNRLRNNSQRSKYNNRDREEHSNRQPQLRFTAAQDNEHSQSPTSQLGHVQTSGYMMVVLYVEQLESAVWDMYQLLHLAMRWNMKLVEPFLLGSYFGIPVPKATGTLVRFRDIYNVTAVNEQFRECTHSKYPLIASYEEFAAQSYAGVWLLDIMKVGVAECSAISRGREDDKLVENRINALSTKVSNGTLNQTIHISKHTCTDARKAIDFEQLPYTLGIPVPKPGISDRGTTDKDKSSHTRSKEQVGIVIRHWTGIRNEPTKFYYHDPDFRPLLCPHIHTLEHSRTVKTAAQLLFAHLKLTRPLLGIHIRLERLIRNLDVEKPGTMKECVGKLMSTVKALKVKYSLKSGQVLAVRDYGALGSQTCRQKQCYRIATELQIDARLTALGVRLADYNPAVLKIPRQSGLASTVEKELISTSDYLLTVGWGSFQRSVRDRILKNHPEDNVEILYTLCSGSHEDHLPNLALYGDRKQSLTLETH